MNNNRHTKIITFTDTVGTIPNHTFTLYSYITGKEYREYQKILMKKAITGESASANLDSETYFESQNYLINTLVIEEDPNKVENILNLPKAVTDFLFSEIDQIVNIDKKK